MVIESTISAYQKVLSTFRFSDPKSFSEEFAQGRFLKKFQVPDNLRSEQLSQLCWEDWIGNDESLPQLRNKTLPGDWYRARAELHKALLNLRLDRFSFPKGSEFRPTKGHNSLEARLCSSSWTTTYENFESFSKICYNHRGLKFAAKKRYSNWYKRQDFDIDQKASDKMLFKHFKEARNPGFAIFQWKLERIVTFTYGSRFSTVPKNNETRRPINIEPFANILTQSQLGAGFRKVLKDHYGQDLDNLQHIHRQRISDMSIATIDLKNASDSISLDLCEFLLPRRVYKMVCERRSPFIYGLDGNVYLPQKVSSMGNGFTFELMSLILTSICRVLDPQSSVYGDDIIISSNKADDLIKLLEEVGLKVNVSKSFTDGPFRESCGGNFHKDEGYIKSFDFMWPTSIHDCIMILNKTYYLSSYPSFKKLYQALVRATPAALHGGPNSRFLSLDPLDLVGTDRSESDQPAIPSFFITPKFPKESRRADRKVADQLRNYGYEPSEFRLITGFQFVSALRSETRRHLNPYRHWAKYFMYLDSSRKAKDVIAGAGVWSEVSFVNSGGEQFRVSTLMT